MQLSASSILFFLFSLSLSVSVFSSACTNETDVFAQVRFVHSASKLGVAQVTCNGVSLGKGLAFGQVTEFFAFAPEEVYTVQVTLDTKEFKPVSVELQPNMTYTFYFAYNSTSKDWEVSFATNQLGIPTNSSLSLINAFLSETAPTTTFEVMRDTSLVFSVDVPYASTSAVPLPTTLTPGNYTVRTLVSGRLFRSTNVTLVDSTSYSVVFVGDPSDTDASRLLILKEADFATTTVTFAHSVHDAGAVAIEVNCQEVFQNVTFGQFAPAGIPVRSYVTAVTILVNGEPVLSDTLRLTRGSNYYVFVTGTVQNKSLAFTVHEDHFSFDQSKSHVSVGNLVPDSQSLMVSYLTNKTQDIKFQGFDEQTVDPDNYNFKFFKSVSLRRRIRMLRRVTGEPLVQKQQSLQAGSSYLVVVQGTMANLTVSVVQTSSPPDNSDSGLSKGAIAGIIIACLVGAILVVGVFVYIYRRRGYDTIG